MIKILLADDDDLIRNGLKIIIHNHIDHTEIDEAMDGTSVLNKVSSMRYNLIIMDVNMPAPNSVNLVKKIFAFDQDVKILMFSMHNDDIYAKQYLQIGAMGYVSKSASEDQILRAIESVLANRKYLSPTLLELLAKDAFLGPPSNPFNQLSERETEILRHLLAGETVSKISQTLDVDTSTVGTYKARIFTKLQCRNIIDVNSLAGLYKFTGQ